MPVQTQLQQRRGTAASWTSTNPTLAAGEIGFESDTGKFKIGNGSTAWASLAYATNGAVVSPLTTKGDLFTYSTTNARLAVGANGESLVADSSTATGLDWKSAAEQYPWQSWSPTYVRLTIGNGTVDARYQQIGKTVHFFWRLVWGSTTSASNYPVVVAPVASRVSGYDYAIGMGQLVDASIGNAYTGPVVLSPTAAHLVISSNYTGSTWGTNGVVDGTNPVTWTTSDVWTITGTYEAA